MEEQEPQTGLNITVLGAGSWGTALAHLLSEKGHSVTLWDRDTQLIDQIRSYHINTKYLPEVPLPANVSASSSIRDAVTPRTDWVVIAVASAGIRSVVDELRQHLPPAAAIISATKGLEGDTGFTMSEVINMLLHDVSYGGLVVLSGPNLALEVVRRVPTVAVSASDDIVLARRAQDLLTLRRSFRVYTHTDVKGVELGGALKNVLAIAAGISDGLGFGDNTKAALLTRGLMEMTQIGLAAGAKALTFLGLAGVGDLMATANSRLSRNYRVGVGIAQRKPLTHALRDVGQAAEGVPTSAAARLLARRHSVQTPLFDTLYEVLYHEKSPIVAVDELMGRPSKDEFVND